MLTLSVLAFLFFGCGSGSKEPKVSNEPEAPPATQPSGPKYTLRFRPRTDRTYRYTMKIESESFGGTSDRSSTTSDMSVTVKEVNGKRKLRMETTNLKVTAEGPSKVATEKLYRDFKYVITMGTYDESCNPTGLAVSGDQSKGAQLVAAWLASGLKGLNLGFMNLILPAEPVQVGSSWQVQVDYGSMLSNRFPPGSVSVEGGQMPARYELTKVEKVGNDEVALVTQTIVGEVKLTLQKQVEPYKIGDQTIVQVKSVTQIKVDVKTGMVLAYGQETSNDTTFVNSGRESKTKQVSKTAVALVVRR